MKRAQVTLFVIVGLLLLLTVGIVFLAVRPSTPDSLSARKDATLVTNFVQQCLAEEAKQGLQHAGRQGGYYTLDGLNIMPGPDSQVIQFSPQLIPIWHEVHSCAENENGCVGDHRPQLCAEKSCPLRIDSSTDVSFQASIEAYVEDNFESCLNNFTSLSAIIVHARDPPEVRALIREEDILLTLTYPLEITTTDNELVDLKEFTTSIAVALPQLYELANEITILQRNTNFIEETWLHFLTVFAGIDSEIPPIRDAQLRGGIRFWVTRNVKEAIEAGIMPFMTFLQVANAMESYSPIETPHIAEEYQPYTRGLYEYLTIKLANEKAYPLGVQFQYPYQTMDLDINGQEFLKGTELPGLGFLRSVSGLTFIQYRFKYSANWPMIVKVTDPYAFNGEGLDLYFGLEGNVKNNRPVNTSRETVAVAAADSSLDLASPEQLVDHTYEVTVTDKHTNEPLDDVGVTYICGTEFVIGATDEQGIWEGKLPYCLAGGFLKIESIEHLATGVPLDNAVDDSGTTPVAIALWPRHPKTVKLYKVPMNDTTPVTLTENETVILTIARQIETQYDGTVPSPGIVEFGTRNSEQEKNDTSTLLYTAYQNGDISKEDYDLAIADISGREEEEITSTTIDLVPGTYDISGFLTYYGLIQIPSKEECGGGFAGIGEKCITLPAQNFTSWNSGGVVLLDEDAVEFTEEDVYGNNELILYVIELPIPATWDQLKMQQPLEDYFTYGTKNLVQPEFRPATP